MRENLTKLSPKDEEKKIMYYMNANGSNFGQY